MLARGSCLTKERELCCDGSAGYWERDSSNESPMLAQARPRKDLVGRAQWGTHRGYPRTASTSKLGRTILVTRLPHCMRQGTGCRQIFPVASLWSSGRRRFRAAESDRGCSLVRRRATPSSGPEHDWVTLPRAASNSLIAPACRSRRIPLRHGDIVVRPEPVFYPFSGVPRHMVKTIGTLACVVRIHCRENRDFMHVVLPEHRDCGVGHSVTPGE